MTRIPGFVPRPALLLLALTGAAVVYVVAAELAKGRFYRGTT